MYRDELLELENAEAELEAEVDRARDRETGEVPDELKARVDELAARVRELHRRAGGVNLRKHYGGALHVTHEHAGPVLDRRPTPKAKPQAARAPRRQHHRAASSKASSDDEGPEPPQAFTAAEVARAVNLSLRTVRRVIAEGQLRAIRLGRAVRVTDNDLRAWLASAPKVR